MWFDHNAEVWLEGSIIREDMRMMTWGKRRLTKSDLAKECIYYKENRRGDLSHSHFFFIEHHLFIFCISDQKHAIASVFLWCPKNVTLFQDIRFWINKCMDSLIKDGIILTKPHFRSSHSKNVLFLSGNGVVEAESMVDNKYAWNH